MSMNRLAIVAAIGTHNTMRNRSDDIRWNSHPQIEAHERPNNQKYNGDVNVLLGGAMFSVALSITCFLCYCCHRSLKRRDIVYQQRWMHVDPNMDIYSVEQYYDITTNNGIDDDQYAQIMRTHGPPPAYEIAVTMKNPTKMGICHLCQNKVRMDCKCDLRTVVKDNELPAKPKRATDHQLLNVQTMSQQQTLHQRTTSESCDKCDNELTCKNNHLPNEDLLNGNCIEDEYCQCATSYKYVPSCRACGKDLYVPTQTSNDPDINDNVPSTSGDGNICKNIGDINSNYEESDDADVDEEGEFDSLNQNGLIRVDMKKLIDDQTGLPTYEAALKLESSGYV